MIPAASLPATRTRAVWIGSLSGAIAARAPALSENSTLLRQRRSVDRCPGPENVPWRDIASARQQAIGTKSVNTALPIFICLLVITLYFLSQRRHMSSMVRGSANLVSAGMILLCLTGFLDTLFLGPDPLWPLLQQRTDLAEVLMSWVGYPSGLLLVGLGLRQWLPALFRLDSEIRRREEAELAARQQAVELMEASLQADLANRAKGRFLAHMSHELRTPLNAILGFSEMLRLEPFGPLGDPRYAGYVVDIHRSGSHLLHLVNDVLDLSKIDAGLEELNDAPMELAVVADEVERLFRPGFQKARVALQVDHDSLRQRLNYDRTKLSRVLINLLGNAMKFTPRDGTVRIHGGRAPGGGMTIIVQDNGVGMSAEQKQVALTAFGQADNRIRHENEGSGLGLPIVKSLVELHGGSLAIDSEPGRGTKVTILVPPDRLLPAEEDASPGALPRTLPGAG
ncbi:sensor histidine kinase [Marinibaculum pumilum]|uniref:histidine kinase n=1 Tax=Marinibaculum pumilum TaxID=1766165 RepID=A0ABV7KZ38_9PROT